MLRQMDSTKGSVDVNPADRSRASAIQTLQKLMHESSTGLPRNSSIDDAHYNSDIQAIIMADNGTGTTTMQTPKEDQPIDIILNGVINARQRTVPKKKYEKDSKARRVSILPIDQKIQVGYNSSAASLGLTPMSVVSMPQHVSDIKMFEGSFEFGETSQQNPIRGTEFSPNTCRQTAIHESRQK